MPDAAVVNRKLLEKGVIVRPIFAYEMPDWLRVSIGLAEENARFLKTMEEILVA